MVRVGEMEMINTPLNFLGVNYYSRVRAKAGPGGPDEPVLLEPGGNVTAAGWEVYPEGLRHVLTRLHDEYQQPKLYVTENGAAFRNSADDHGEVHDADRVRYLRTHLEAARQAMADGVPLEGYFV